MKYKKYTYILVLLLTLVIGINKTYAVSEQTCNYLSNDNTASARLTIKWGYALAFLHGGKAYSEALFQNIGGYLDNDTEEILNWYSGFSDNGISNMTLNAIYNGSGEANKNPQCPKHLIMRIKTDHTSYGAYATNSTEEAKKFVNASNSASGYKAWYLSYKNADGTKITDEQYYEKGFGGFIEGESVVDHNAKITCTDLFGDKKDKDSLAYLINEILGLVRIVVPILVIVLGMIDLAKAVLASKEDEMKKAQSTFIKRVFIGVVVFFIPLLVDVIMVLADIVWEGMGYSICEFK